MQQTIYALAPSPAFATDGICFAAGYDGLYRSTDGGTTWQPAQASLNLPEPLPATAVALSPAFAADRRVFAGAPGGVLRSIDGGETWLVTALPSPPTTISTLVVSPNFTEDGVVLAGTIEDGILRTADRGERWSPWNFGLLDFHVLALALSPAFADDEMVFAGTESGLFRSTNGGRAWREVDFSPDRAPVVALALSPAFAGCPLGMAPEDGVIFVGTEEHGLYRSDDGGATWTRVGEDAVRGAVNGIILAPDYPATPHLLVIGDGLLISRDDGAMWSALGADALRPEGTRAGVISGAAPLGLAPGTPLLVGLESGGVRRITIEH